MDSPSREPFELYNVIGDPSEEQNLIDLYPEIAERMREQLDSWSVSVSRSALGADYPEGKGSSFGPKVRSPSSTSADVLG